MSVKRLVPLHAAELPSDPPSGRSGDIYYNTTDNQLKFYNGTAWQPFTADATSELLIHTHTYDGAIFSVEEASVSATDVDGGSTIESTDSVTLDGGTA
jgi:hypothetical protein